MRSINRSMRTDTRRLNTLDKTAFEQRMDLLELGCHSHVSRKHGNYTQTKKPSKHHTETGVGHEKSPLVRNDFMKNQFSS